MRRTMAVGLCVVLLLTLMAGVALAQGKNKIHGIYVGGFLIMRLRAGTPELSLSERREVVQQRATDMMMCTDTGKVNVSTLPYVKCTTKCVPVGRNYNVYANGRLIVTVTKADAIANKTTIYRQAEQWANRIEEVFPRAYNKCNPMGPKSGQAPGG
jgi:hypothetical protein